MPDPTHIILSAYFSRASRDAPRDLLHMIAAFQSLPAKIIGVRITPVHVNGEVVGGTLICTVVPETPHVLHPSRSHWSQPLSELATWPSTLSADRRVVVEGWIRNAGIQGYGGCTAVLPILSAFVNADEIFVEPRFHTVLLETLALFAPRAEDLVRHHLRITNPAASEAFHTYVNGHMVELRRKHTALFRAGADETCTVCLEKFTEGVGGDFIPNSRPLNRLLHRAHTCFTSTATATTARRRLTRWKFAARCAAPTCRLLYSGFVTAPP